MPFERPRRTDLAFHHEKPAQKVSKKPDSRYAGSKKPTRGGPRKKSPQISKELREEMIKMFHDQKQNASQIHEHFKQSNPEITYNQVLNIINSKKSEYYGNHKKFER